MHRLVARGVHMARDSARSEGKHDPLATFASTGRCVNAGEKVHRRAGVKMHHGRMGEGRPRMQGTRPGSVTPNSAFQFDQ
jgi:hypothetical protein